ncbi:proline and serine-rich protein 2 [Triplophysa dalaica]|uniref:proline and serine-rich protein 2 n=1 Tax=Triplophysa dalaica TaxID=1582913 RepID=UPI0024DFBAC1|nr:proline and serine-rich protein 2 [Triplophysa dalaica]
MDVHVHRTPHYGLKDRQPEDDLQFLSLEERECILFFEETIGSLEEEFENDGAGRTAQRHTPAEMRPASYERDHDIIDLVHVTPEDKRTNVMPDFQKLIIPPETHYEMKPQREPPMNFPPGLNITSPASEEGGHLPPPGSIPTPVVIASKIAEHQGANSASASPSVLLQRRLSLELPQNPVTKHGPPTHAKPTHLPDNISLLLGSREHIPHSIAMEAVNAQERRAQMLANLTGPAHPLEGGEPSCVRNLPTRSVSFRQPTPDQSRMEALSKLGLAQRRTQSVMQPSADFNKDSSSGRTALRSNSTSRYTLSSVNEPTIASMPPQNANMAINHKNGSTSKVHGFDTTDYSQSKSTVDRQDKSSQSAAITSGEIRHGDFNSYGGKSIILNPATSFKSGKVPHHNATSPKSNTPEVHLNSFGGWSRVMNPSVAHSDEPNPAYSSYSQSPPNTSRISPPNAYGARSKTFSPVKEVSITADEDSPTRDAVPLHPKPPFHPAATRPAEQSPSAASRPARHSGPLSPTKPRASPTSQEIRSKPTVKQSFRTQGITVQFSGKGATDEARRDALRKLGLMRGGP